MQASNQKAFTMVELIYVIVIIGILSAIAIPKLGGTVEQAYMTKGKSTLAAVRGAISTERQKRILQGIFDDITVLNGSGGVFTTFDDANGSKVLQYDVQSCTDIGCWSTGDGITYTFYREGSTCTFKLEDNHFKDTTASPGCTELKY
jgi:general secretion pathway protein G